MNIKIKTKQEEVIVEIRKGITLHLTRIEYHDGTYSWIGAGDDSEKYEQEYQYLMKTVK